VLTADTAVTWSLRSDSNGRPSPYRGDALTARATKARAGRAGLEPASSHGSTPADRATGHRGPRSVSNRCLTLTRRPLCLLSYRGEVSSARFERALPTSSRWCLLPLGYEDVEPPPGVDPGHPPYEGGAAAVRGGKAGHPGFEPGNSGFRARRVCQIPPMAIGCGRWESNPHEPCSSPAFDVSALPPLPLVLGTNYRVHLCHFRSARD
jgi:hypothetical protein